MGYRKTKNHAKKREKPNTKRNKVEQSHKSGFKYSEINKQLKYIPKVEPVKKHKKTKVDYRTDKVQWLMSQGYGNPFDTFTLKEIDSIHISELKKGTLSPDKVPFLKSVVDFDKVKELPSDNHLFIAYRCYSFNTFIKDIIPLYALKSNGELIDITCELLTRPATHARGQKNDSSGQDGEVKFLVGTNQDLNYERMQADDKTRDDKRYKQKIDRGVLRKRQHTGDVIGYQKIQLHKDTFISQMSAREALILFSTVASSISEVERATFNRLFYTRVFVPIFPELLSMLPDYSQIK